MHRKAFGSTEFTRTQRYLNGGSCQIATSKACRTAVRAVFSNVSLAKMAEESDSESEQPLNTSLREKSSDQVV